MVRNLEKRFKNSLSMHSLIMSGPGWQMKEIELTPKTEEVLEAI